MSDYLIHYGVKGMKWGVRKQHPASSRPRVSRGGYRKMAYQAYDTWDPMIWEERRAVLQNPQLKKKQRAAEARASRAGHVDRGSYYKDAVKTENELREQYRKKRAQQTRKYVDSLLSDRISVKDFDRMSGGPSIRPVIDDHYKDLTMDEIKILFPERINGGVVRDYDGRVITPKKHK